MMFGRFIDEQEPHLEEHYKINMSIEDIVLRQLSNTFSLNESSFFFIWNLFFDDLSKQKSNLI